MITVAALFIGGIILILIELLHKEDKNSIDKIEDIPLKQAAVIGLAQSVAMVPGVSRSAATIIGALLLKVKRKTAVEFSFLLAVPTMLSATGLDLIQTRFAFTPYEYSILAVGFIGAFAVAILAIKFILKYIERNNFIPFGIYRIIVAILFFVFVL
jgi:undecaprenyl-diphosphatase